ncbi:acyl-CoA dehydrogenase family protein [Mycobacterium sp.]|uniref:acyl-CoA dehydrogenase family protein n=1 Tax=Mycobacterium sp. TaxID=1785 RepID=UPI002D98589A|nr:acyl-CoA dehydrogenase family protein [Mycobacterium sp.]
MASTSVDAVERAAALLPHLRDRTEEAERLRRMPDETIEAIEDAGLLWMAAPKHYGGQQAPLADVLAVSELFGRASGSASWSIALYTASPYLLAKFDDEAQDEVYASGHPFMCGVVTPSAQLSPANGGYRLTGHWRFATGNRHAKWGQMAAMMMGPDGPQGMAWVMVPRSDWTAHDDWFVTGLVATGSSSISVDDVFVPAHRILHASDFDHGISRRFGDDPYFKIPMAPFFTACTSATPVGMATGALELFEERVQKRAITYLDYASAADATVTHLQVDEAVMKLDQARFHMRHALAMAESLRETPGDISTRARLKGDVGWCSRLGREVVDIVQKGSGASSLNIKDPLQRLVRDAQAMSLHGVLASNTNAEVHGRVRCGLPPNTNVI